MLTWNPVLRRIVTVAVLVASLCGVRLVGSGVRVGDRTNEGTIVPTGRAVAASGPTAILSSPVVDCVVTADEARVVIKTANSVVVVSLGEGKELSSARIEGGASLTGIALSPDGSTIACSTAGNFVSLFHLEGGTITSFGSVRLPNAHVGGASYPCGLLFLDSGRLAVAANRDNAVLLVDLADRRVTSRIPVDTAPYALATEDPNHLLVTCWGASNRPGRPTSTASGTAVEVDRRGIAVAGSLCRVDLSSKVVTQRVGLPLQPTEVVSANRRIYVACANGDAVLALDSKNLAVLETIRTGGATGSAPDSLSIDLRRETLYVALGGLDRVGAYDLAGHKWIGFMRTAWYPTSVRSTSKGLVVATAKGIGSRNASSAKHQVYDFTSTVSCIPRPQFSALLPTEPIEGHPRVRVVPVPVPSRTGEPSLIKHIVYVIKENRTYDQLLGDMGEGNGDPALTIYGEEVTPNHHSIARQFVLLDNYYCNGILSADGHAWATESNATTYYEHSHGGWTRSYPFGDDPLATSASGYIWDDALDHGRSVRNFGEFDYASPIGAEGAFEILSRFQAGKRERFNQNIGVVRLRGVSERDYPGWNLSIPDVLRADRFTRRLRELERTGAMADLTIVYLPQDHTSGGSAGFPTPRAQVADNDLGVGKVIEALSRSKFWPTSVVFVEEDDPQDGFDHVDGHRSLCLLAGPYVRRGAVISRFYNQASVLHTIERILGLPPMNLNDAEAPVMTECFQASADFRSYVAKPNRIPLNEKRKQTDKVSFDLRRPDQVDDDAFNRRLWKLAGKAAPYPVR